ncbi:MAG: M23 family metallopeptidase [Bacteroidales bacterium]|nr:M23 family metallopeptidase [Bacteroidales bacterium]
MPRYVFNPITLQYEVREEPRYVRHLRNILIVVSVIGLCILYFWLYTDVLGWDLPKTARLKKENAVWQSKIALAERQMDICEVTLNGIEERDDFVYRSIFGLNVIPEEVKEAKTDPEADKVTKRLDALTKRAYVQTMALDEVYGIAINAGDMVSHIPAVPPILPKRGSYRMASPFGYRVDPVYGGTRFHAGQDFAADVGYPVYVTGDGVVEKVNYGFTGYGNEIIIDHGFGYKTRYAHLSRIDVAKGMKVLRGD